MTDEERIGQPLYKKIENMLPIIYEVCMSNAFKEKWTWPKRAPNTGLFKDKYCKSCLISFDHPLFRSSQKEEEGHEIECR